MSVEYPYAVDLLAEQAQIDIDHAQYFQARQCKKCSPNDDRETDYPLLCYTCKRWYNCGVDITGRVLKPGE